MFPACNRISYTSDCWQCTGQSCQQTAVHCAFPPGSPAQSSAVASSCPCPPCPCLRPHPSPEHTRTGRGQRVSHGGRGNSSPDPKSHGHIPAWPRAGYDTRETEVSTAAQSSPLENRTVTKCGQLQTQRETAALNTELCSKKAAAFGSPECCSHPPGQGPSWVKAGLSWPPVALLSSRKEIPKHIP